MNNTINYSDMVKDIIGTIKADNSTQNKWVQVGNEVRAFYGTELALSEVKAQFIADAILPALDKKYGEALAKDLPRKGSKEFNENVAKDPSYQDKWQQADKAKRDARATVGTFYNRIKNYAFPPEKKESVKKSFVEKISALIVEGGKIKECDFDLVSVMQFLIQAEKVAKKAL